MTTNNNLKLYDTMRVVPAEAKKTIAGGPLKGFTDINPMWRIKTLTEHLGPCGVGWYADVVDRWCEEGCGERAVFVKVHLYVRQGEGWSAPIVGVGGSKTVVVDKNGPHLTDEGYKMAFTDAISVACKMLGMAADVYFEKDAKMSDNRTKYDQQSEAASAAVQARRAAKAATPSAPAPAPAYPKYQPLPEEQYWAVIRAYATGKTPKAGGDYRETFRAQTHAGREQMEKFDRDVDNVRAAIMEAQ